MTSRFVRPHIDLSPLRSSSEFTGVSSGPGSSAIRIREEHGRRLRQELDSALQLADESRMHDNRLPEADGAYLEVELRRGGKVEALERKKEGVRPGAVKDESNDARTVALFVPDGAREALRAILDDYSDGALTEKGKPQRANVVEPIENFRRAHLKTFWTDTDESFPDDPGATMWWGLWCDKGRLKNLEEAVSRLELRMGGDDRRLMFPEAIVVPVYGTRAAIELLTFATGAVLEIRRASDTPSFFIDEVRGDQHAWSNDLAERIEWPPLSAPSVCVLDTGMNRAHVLLEPALAVQDLHALDISWGVDDHEPHGHGTAMGGLALHGDLTTALSSTGDYKLHHRLESVKLLPPGEHDPNSPDVYGRLTQDAVSLPEIAMPERPRVFCLAATNDGVTGAIASGWSAAIDQAAAGARPGDEEDAPRRLFILASGNVSPEIDASKLVSQEDCAIEDPAQAWNAITVGAYTDLVEIADKGFEDWKPLAEVGDLSPHSRTSNLWSHSKSPIKPDLVMEGGNRAESPAGTEVLTLDSLSLLSTGKDVDREPLVSFQATSAAAAQAARLAARLQAAHPEYWPETIRALMVHSAEWTPAMKQQFTERKTDNYPLVRKFGYGVPDFARAQASATDHLALVVQSEIQPFRLEGQRKFNECHYYPLPIPSDILEELDNHEIELKITLSYFIEPNPGMSANVDPRRYQSHGLRFHLRRNGESISEFKKRVNAAEREYPTDTAPSPSDDRWMMGRNSISAGSLHCDVWRGPAVDLLQRNMICVHPIVGWWRERANKQICESRSRYSLVVTIKSPEVEVDLYTPIKNMIEFETSVHISV